MPLRDHFHPPLDDIESWEGVHAQWPAMMVLSLTRLLPPDFVAVPRVHIGSVVEVDIGTLERGRAEPAVGSVNGNGGGVAAATWAPAAPSLSVETDLAMADEYEVRVYDARRGRRLVAAVEIVSPSNKDRPESRRAFVAKCAALLHNRVAIAVVDLVTARHFNLYRDLLDFVGQVPPADAPPVYAVAGRMTDGDGIGRLEAWYHPLAVGRPLPTLPLWLDAERFVPLELEATYEDTCRALRIP
ncbi:MAG: DUF4058 family protein [Gemmataceae bacterium]